MKTVDEMVAGIFNTIQYTLFIVAYYFILVYY